MTSSVLFSFDQLDVRKTLNIQSINQSINFICWHRKNFSPSFSEIMMSSSRNFFKYPAVLFLTIFGFICLHQYLRSSFQEKCNMQAKGRINPTVYIPRVLTEMEKIRSIRQSCGPLCDTSRPGTRGPYFNHVTAPINCKSIFQNPYIDEGHTFKVPPKEIPKELRDDYTMGNRVSVSPWYFNQIYLGSQAKSPLWTKEWIDNDSKLAAAGSLAGNYGRQESNELRLGMKNAPGIKNGRVLVIGSENPWVEAIALEVGAKEIVTLEYGRIISKHPKVKPMVPSEFRASFLNGTLGLFDAVVTFSSVEHSGLGRYGDRLNPWGDIIAVARAWCVTKVDGSLTIGVMYQNGKDFIFYNAHRVYGNIRYPYLVTNWKQLYRGNGLQRVHVFTKIDPQF
jgi:hypothetical protein